MIKWKQKYFILERKWEIKVGWKIALLKINKRISDMKFFSQYIVISPNLCQSWSGLVSSVQLTWADRRQLTLELLTWPYVTLLLLGLLRPDYLEAIYRHMQTVSNDTWLFRHVPYKTSLNLASPCTFGQIKTMRWPKTSLINVKYENYLTVKICVLLCILFCKIRSGCFLKYHAWLATLGLRHVSRDYRDYTSYIFIMITLLIM